MLLLSIFKISGHSMEPAIKKGDRIIVSGIIYLFRKPKIKDIIIFKHDDLFLVKRIVKIQENKYFVEGDNKRDSLDSRKIGSLFEKQILAKVLYKL